MNGLRRGEGGEAVLDQIHTTPSSSAPFDLKCGKDFLATYDHARVVELCRANQRLFDQVSGDVLSGEFRLEYLQKAWLPYVFAGLVECWDCCLDYQKFECKCRSLNTLFWCNCPAMHDLVSCMDTLLRNKMGCVFSCFLTYFSSTSRPDVQAVLMSSR